MSPSMLSTVSTINAPYRSMKGSHCATTYNLLPSLEEAYSAFVNPEILPRLTSVFSNFRDYAVCLVHRHCSLEDGEVMVATGNVTQPESEGTYYPHSWLANGEPFEFTREETPSLPAELLHEFGQIVNHVNLLNGMNILGIQYIREACQREAWVERSEGRKNILVKATVNLEGQAPHDRSKTIPTCWVPGIVDINSVTPATPLVHCQCVVISGTHLEIC